MLFVVGGYYLVQARSASAGSKNINPNSPSSSLTKFIRAQTRSVVYIVMEALGFQNGWVPSLNVCMNCHAAINDYKGKLFIVRTERK